MHREVDVEVWCRKNGPIKARYDALGVPCRVTPAMPYTSAVPRFSRNVYSFARFAAAWNGSRSFREELNAAARDRFDLVHFNLEGLFLLMHWLRRRMGRDYPMTMHMRTTQPPNVFTRWQFRSIVRDASRCVFIAESNWRHTELLVGAKVPGIEIHNIVTVPDSVAPSPELLADSCFKVAVLSNYDYTRGIDRLIDVARALAERGRRGVLFVVAGTVRLPRSLPGELGQVARRGGTLADFAQQKGVADMFRFLGHVADPYPVVAACDLLAKPTREYNPWGRDILEGMAFAKPAISVGTYDRFVENGVTGILHPEFDVEQWADEIVRLVDDRALLAALGGAAQERVLNLCDGPSRARDLRDFWADVIAKKAKQQCAA